MLKNKSYLLLVDNTRNTQRHQNKQRATFYDDLGVWDSSKGTTTKSYYVISQCFKCVFLKQNLYCASQVVKKQKNFRLEVTELLEVFVCVKGVFENHFPVHLSWFLVL
jgi:predicted ATPase